MVKVYNHLHWGFWGITGRPGLINLVGFCLEPRFFEICDDINEADVIMTDYPTVEAGMIRLNNPKKFYIVFNFEKSVNPSCFSDAPNVFNIGFFHKHDKSCAWLSLYFEFFIEMSEFGELNEPICDLQNFEERYNNWSCYCYRRLYPFRSEILKYYEGSPFRTCGMYNPVDFYKQKLSIMEKYLFYLPVENGDQPFYVTEKLYEAMMSGCIPIYWGGNCRLYSPFNPERIITINSFGNSFRKIPLRSWSKDKLEEIFNKPLLRPDWKEWLDDVKKQVEFKFMRKWLLFKKGKI